MLSREVAGQSTLLTTARAMPKSRDIASRQPLLLVLVARKVERNTQPCADSSSRFVVVASLAFLTQLSTLWMASTAQTL